MTGSIFDLTEEQQMLAESVSRLHQDVGYPVGQQEGSPGQDGEVWRALSELGVATATFPEALGGVGLSLADLAPALTEAGRFSTREPILGAILGGCALSLLAEPNEFEIDVDAIETGDTVLATAIAAEGAFELSNDADTVLVSAKLPSTFDAAKEGSLLLAIPGDQSDLLCIIDLAAEGVSASPFRLLDGRSAADITLANVRVSASRSATLPQGSCEALKDMAAVILCADALGAYEAMRDLTRNYLPERKQFGVPLATHQVLRHSLVDMYHDAEHLKSLLHLAARSCGETDRNSRVRAVSSMKRMMGTRIRVTGASAVQMHGGIGFTEEYAVGQYLKRLLVSETMFGTSDEHAKRLAALVAEEVRSSSPLPQLQSAAG